MTRVVLPLQMHIWVREHGQLGAGGGHARLPEPWVLWPHHRRQLCRPLPQLHSGAPADALPRHHIHGAGRQICAGDHLLSYLFTMDDQLISCSLYLCRVFSVFGAIICRDIHLLCVFSKFNASIWWDGLEHSIVYFRSISHCISSIRDEQRLLFDYC